MRLRPIVPLLLVLLTWLALPTASGQPAWTLTSTGITGSRMLLSVAYGNGHFVATDMVFGKSGALWSRDGVSWTFASTVMAGGGNVIFSAGQFYLLTTDGLWQSTDGITWQHTQVMDMHATDRNYVNLIGAGDHTLLLTNTDPDGSLQFSPDMVTLQKTAPLPGAELGADAVRPSTIVYAAHRYYVSYWRSLPSTTTALVTTTDGKTWSPVAAVGPINGGQIAGGADGRFVAITGSNTVTTTDGVTYRTTSNPAIADNMVYAAGDRYFTSDSLVTSHDGIGWTSLSPVNLSYAGILDFAYGNGRYVGVGLQNAGTSSTQTDLIAYIDLPGPPTIQTPPSPQTVVEGRAAALTVTADESDATTTYQWYHDGAAVSGATTATISVPATKPADAGKYSVTVRNPLGSTSTEPVALSVIPIAQAGRLVNLSVLTPIDRADETLVTGFVVGGAGTSGTKALLVRAVGPTLANYGVGIPNPDPRLELFNDSTQVAENDNWGGDPSVAKAISATGAFALTGPDSKDAAYFATAVQPGNHSVHVLGTNGATGTVIAEVYDATPGDQIMVSTPRLMNVSAMKSLTQGETLTAGFVIGGALPKTVLIRAVGPGLLPYGVGDAASDTRLAVYRSGETTPFLTNEDWGGTPALTAAFQATGAFQLPAGSKDSAVLSTLSPGNYSVQATASAAGTVMIEVYDVP